MKKVICGVEYEVKPIPPSLAPYHARISDLLQRKPQSIQEVKDLTNELRVLIKELLKETVRPEPPEEVELEAYNALIDVTNETMKQAKFFPKNQSSFYAEEGGGVGSAAAQAPKRDSQAKSSEV